MSRCSEFERLDTVKRASEWLSFDRSIIYHVQRSGNRKLFWAFNIIRFSAYAAKRYASCGFIGVHVVWIPSRAGKLRSIVHCRQQRQRHRRTYFTYSPLFIILPTITVENTQHNMPPVNSWMQQQEIRKPPIGVAFEQQWSMWEAENNA